MVTRAFFAVAVRRAHDSISLDGTPSRLIASAQGVTSLRTGPREWTEIDYTDPLCDLAQECRRAGLRVAGVMPLAIRARVPSSLSPVPPRSHEECSRRPSLYFDEARASDRALTPVHFIAEL